MVAANYLGLLLKYSLSLKLRPEREEAGQLRKIGRWGAVALSERGVHYTILVVSSENPQKVSVAHT